MTHRGRKRATPTAPPERRAPVVTDHALVRWVERVVGVDLRSKVEADILGEGRAEIIRRIGTGRMHLAAHNATIRFCNGRVITVTPRAGKGE